MTLPRIMAVTAALLFSASLAQARGPKEMSVQVEKTPLRERPSPLGKVAGELSYGDRVAITRAQGPWRNVTFGDKAGWLHESALSRKKIVLKAGAEDVSTTASGEELALAGKGFNSQVETEFKAKNADVDFTWIDKMESWTVSPVEALAFLKKGGVTPEGGVE